MFIRTPIQLAGDDLTNNHTNSLLSGLPKQILYYKNTIAPGQSGVNAKLSSENSESREESRLFVYCFCRILRMLFSDR